jgi:hypothetical protein
MLFSRWLMGTANDLAVKEELCQLNDTMETTNIFKIASGLSKIQAR